VGSTVGEQSIWASVLVRPYPGPHGRAPSTHHQTQLTVWGWLLADAYGGSTVAADHRRKTGKSEKHILEKVPTTPSTRACWCELLSSLWILQALPFTPMKCLAALHHHERGDGIALLGFASLEVCEYLRVVLRVGRCSRIGCGRHGSARC
jgi:hypothetical protein